MARLLLVRHGQSTWNATGRWQGWADPPLSDLGRQQAKDAARHVGAVDLVVASDLIRARETAEIIADEIGGGPVEIDPAYRERDAGDWTGLTRDEIEERDPGALDRGDQPAGFENDAALVARALPAVLALEGRGDTILVVSHGGLIGALERSCGAAHARIPNLGGTAFRLADRQLLVEGPLLLVDPDDVTVTAPPEV